MIRSVLSWFRGLFVPAAVVEEEVIMPDSEARLISIVLSEEHVWVQAGDFPHLFCSYYEWVISFWRYGNVLHLSASTADVSTNTRVDTDAESWGELLELHSSAMGKAQKIEYV